MIKKTIVRATVIQPECRAEIYRLYDMETTFHVTRQTITDADAVIELVRKLIAREAVIIKERDYISDDDLEGHHSVTYEYISE